MSNNNIMKKKRTTLKDMYDYLGLRYDLREAKRLLKDNDRQINKEASRQEINRGLRTLYYERKNKNTKPTYLITLTGTSQQRLKSGEWGAKDPISMTFQSQDKLKKSELEGVMNEDEVSPALYQAWNDLGFGYNKINIVTDVKITKFNKMKKDLKEVPLYYPFVNVPKQQFNGFKDTGNMMCVPEVLLHHLKLNNKNKKLTLDKLIDELEEDYIHEYEHYFKDGNNQIHYKFKEQSGVVLSPDEARGRRGYTAEDIKRVLTKHKCVMRLMDVNEEVFMSNIGEFEDQRNLKSFLGQVYNEHLYYCDDEKFVKTISEKCKTNTQNTAFSQEVYDKKLKQKQINYEIIETSDLLDYYKEHFKDDNTIRQVRTKDGRITKIVYDDKVVCANPYKTYMQEILGDDFENQNPVTFFEQEFKKHFPNHKTSSFTKATFDMLGADVKHTGITQVFNLPQTDELHEYDTVKCRTSKLRDNELGDYEKFSVQDEIQTYSGKITKGWYYVILKSEHDMLFFMRGNQWYSGDFVNLGLKEGFNVSIKYELRCSETIPHDYFKKWVEKMIEKYPTCYKGINLMIGHRGKTKNELRDGYIETDFDLAVSAFWDNNDEGIGFIYDKRVHKRLWRTLKGKLCNVSPLPEMTPEQYVVETVNYKTLYENDVPIYNKNLENEMVAMYRLRKSLRGRLIAIKTDAVIVEGKHNKILLSEEIGGIKHTLLKKDDLKIYGVNANNLKVKNNILDYSYYLDLDFKWNTITETDKWLLFDKPLPTGSYLVTALAGYGKSHFVKQQPEYDEETTLRTGFTNVAVENISDANHPSQTLNSYFGIDCFSGKVSEKKLKNLRNIKTIIVTEVFMVPSYIMATLLKIKEAFPEIKFIVEGDPEQNRPVKEEKINWLNTRLLHQLCDGNLVKLTINKRNNETANYHKILDGKPLPSEKYEYRDPQRVNICRTNAMRVTLNDKLMDKSGYFIKRSKANQSSQDIWLTLDTPIMCVKGDKKLGIKNGKFYTLESIEKNKIVIDSNEYTDEQFAALFVVAFAYTNHKVQGLTIKEQYNIYEWSGMINYDTTHLKPYKYKRQGMSRREKYTAYSRTSDGNNVRIIKHYEINHALVNDLKRYFRCNYCIYKWSSTVCNDTYIGHTKDFKKRKDEHVKDSATKSNDLYVKMRETGLETWTMELLEEFYAENREEAEAREQEYITMMQPNLNMCAAKKI